MKLNEFSIDLCKIDGTQQCCPDRILKVIVLLQKERIHRLIHWFVKVMDKIKKEEKKNRVLTRHKIPIVYSAKNVRVQKKGKKKRKKVDIVSNANLSRVSTTYVYVYSHGMQSPQLQFNVKCLHSECVSLHKRLRIY